MKHTDFVYPTSGLVGSAQCAWPKQALDWLRAVCAGHQGRQPSLPGTRPNSPQPPCERPCIDKSQQYGRMRPLPINYIAQ